MPPFQDASDLTIISTNFGDGGNAHSEYLGPLSEQGIPETFNNAITSYFYFLQSVNIVHKIRRSRFKTIGNDVTFRSSNLFYSWNFKQLLRY